MCEANYCNSPIIQALLAFGELCFPWTYCLTQLEQVGFAQSPETGLASSAAAARNSDKTGTRTEWSVLVDEMEL